MSHLLLEDINDNFKIFGEKLETLEGKIEKIEEKLAYQSQGKNGVRIYFSLKQLLRIN